MTNTNNSANISLTLSTEEARIVQEALDFYRSQLVAGVQTTRINEIAAEVFLQRQEQTR
jgi:hypothetical protein